MNLSGRNGMSFPQGTPWVWPWPWWGGWCLWLWCLGQASAKIRVTADTGLNGVLDCRGTGGRHWLKDLKIAVGIRRLRCPKVSGFIVKLWEWMHLGLSFNQSINQWIQINLPTEPAAKHSSNHSVNLSTNLSIIQSTQPFRPLFNLLIKSGCPRKSNQSSPSSINQCEMPFCFARRLTTYWRRKL